MPQLQSFAPRVTFLVDIISTQPQDYVNPVSSRIVWSVWMRLTVKFVTLPISMKRILRLETANNAQYYVSAMAIFSLKLAIFAQHSVVTLWLEHSKIVMMEII